MRIKLKCEPFDYDIGSAHCKLIPKVLVPQLTMHKLMLLASPRPICIEVFKFKLMKSCPPALDRSEHAGICLKVAQVEASESIYDKRYTIEMLLTSFLLSWATKNLLLTFQLACLLGSSAQPEIHEPIVIVVSPLNALLHGQIKNYVNLCECQCSGKPSRNKGKTSIFATVTDLFIC